MGFVVKMLSRFKLKLLLATVLLIQPSATLQTVGIVGAGPAGLTLAVALNRALPDVAVTVFDRSDSCRPALGGGVQLNSGAAVLARLDPALGAAVAKLGQPVRRVRSRTAGGDALLDLDLAAAIRGNARARERGLVDADGGVRAYTIMRDVPQATLCEVLETGQERKAHRFKLSGAGCNWRSASPP